MKAEDKKVEERSLEERCLEERCPSSVPPESGVACTPGSAGVSEAVLEEILTVLPEGKQLFPFQYTGVKFLAGRERALLADEPGLGKTVQLIVAANVVRARAARDISVMVLSPKSVRLNWEREIERWSIPGIHWKVFNWEKLLLDPWAKEMIRPWDIVIGDESHQCIKTPVYTKKLVKEGVRCKPRATRCGVFMKKVVPLAKRVWLATATPASKSGADYYCTLQILLPGTFGGMNVRRFEKVFCKEIPDRWATSGYRYEGFNNIELLRDTFKTCALKRYKEKVLPDLPPKIVTDIEIDIDPKVAAMHLEIDAAEVIDCIIHDKPLPGHLAKVMQATALAKIEAANEIISNMPDTESVVCFAWHTVVVEEWVKKLEKFRTVGSITGKVTNENKRNSFVDRFQRKELNTLVNNTQAGGVGLTLTAARTALYIEPSFSVIHMEQSMNRVHRIGSTGPVQIIRMIGTGTIDKEIYQILDERMKMIRKVGV